MDLVFISKLLILVLLYYLTNYIYRKNDWHTPGQIWKTNIAKRVDNFLSTHFNTSLGAVWIFTLVIIWGIPLVYTSIGIGFIILIQEFFEMLNTKGYWEQILISFGVISLLFSIRIYFDGREMKILEKDLLIKSQQNTIYELKRKIKELETL